MPRSAPGPATGAPSSSTRPVVGRSSPATMRSSVDLPQPDGPSRQMKSLSATQSEVGSMARVGGPPRTPGKVRLTSSMKRVGTLLSRSGQAPGKQPLVQGLEKIVRDEPDHADDHDAEDDLARVEQGLAVRDHVSDAAGGPDQLGHDDVGPRPAENQTQRFGDVRRARGQQHAPDDAARARPQRVGGLDEIAPGRAHDDGDHEHDLKERADEDDGELFLLSDARPQDEERDEARGG